jgi:putative transposase
VSRPPRIQGFNYKGPYRYLLTFCTHLRRHIFQDDCVAAETLARFRITAAEFQFAILAYCLMPDHIHLLVEGLSAQSDLLRFVPIGKQRTAYSYSKATGGRRLWQEGFHDRSLRRDDDIKATARYVLENPVRAGLATSPQDYKYCGSDVWTIEDVFSA